MGVEIETDGIGEGWYEQGQYENVSIVDATTVEGLYFEGVGGGSVTAVSPFELGFVGGFALNMLVGLDVSWHPKAKEITIHGLHSVATSPDSKNYTVINYTCTSEQSHTQTVNGPTTWTNNGDFTLMAAAAPGKISISTINSGTISLTVNTAQLSLATAATSLQGDATTVTGTTSAQLSCGGNSVLLNANQASLKFGTAGITATGAATTLSGTKVEIGVPGAANPAIATQPAVTAATRLATDANAEATLAQTRINQLKAELNTLKTKCVPRASILAALA